MEMDYLRLGSTTSSIASCSSAMALTRLPGRLSTASTVGREQKGMTTTTTSRMQGFGRLRAASGSVQQKEEVAAVRTLAVGQFIVQGLREEMEDEIVVDVNGPHGFMYAGIFDGHAGVFSAIFLRDELYKECLTALEGGAILESNDFQEAEQALSRAFLQVDQRLISRLESSTLLEETESGTTATVVFARPDRLVIAYVGDSRVVLSSNGKALDLTIDHRPFGREKKSFLEVKRIQEAGGWVSHGRVCGTLAVSRAFGDTLFKTRKQEMLDNGIAERRWTERFASGRNLDGEWLIATPDTSSMLVNEEAEFLIAASDGLWDCMKSAEAVDFVRKRLKEHGDVQRASEEVGQEALNRGSQDNVSVIIIDFGRTELGGEGAGWKFW